jgi:large subunit ribosomal protein L18
VTSLKVERAADADKSKHAEQVGEAIAQLCIGKGIKSVVFDRNGYIYHGRVKALAEGARKGGLEF